MMFLTICVILFNIHIGLHLWRILKHNAIEMDTIQQYKMHDYEPTDQQGFLLHTTLRCNQMMEMMEKNSCQSKDGSDLSNGKNAIAVLVIGKRCLYKSRNEILPRVLHQVLSSETSAEKGYPFPSHPRNPC